MKSRVALLFALVALPALAQDDWAARAALGAKVRGQTIAALSSEGFTLGAAKHSWHEEPSLSFAVLRATVRDSERRRDLASLARFALEERLFAEARSVVAELGQELDVGHIEALSVFRASGTSRKGRLEVPLGPRDFAPTSFVGPLMKRLLPEQILGVAVERPGQARLEARGQALVLGGTWPRAHGRPLGVVASSELTLAHEGLPAPNAYFGFDLVTAEDAPVRALYAVASADEAKIDVELVDGRGRLLEHVTTRALAARAKLTLVAGPVCRLLADGREVARIAAASAFVVEGTNRVKPVLAVAAGPVARTEGRFGALVLGFTPDPAWLERATAASRSAIRRGLGLEAEALRAAGEHFTLETDLGPSSLAAFAKDLDAAFAAFDRVHGAATWTEKVSVKVFGTDDDYGAFVETLGRAEERCTGGFYLPRANAIVMRVDDATPRVRLVHEAFHAYAARALPKLPAWLAEGLAEREALRFTETPLRYKRGPLIEALRHPRAWRALLGATSAEFHDRAARLGGTRSAREKESYLLAWSLCEIAARKPDGEAARLVERTLGAARRGERFDPASVDVPALEAEWRTFAKEATAP